MQGGKPPPLPELPRQAIDENDKNVLQVPDDFARRVLAKPQD
jgi:hypothetical protein